MSLLQRLMLLVALAVLPAVLIHAYNEASMHRLGQRIVEDEARRLLHMVESEQDRIIEGVRQVLLALTESDALRQGDVAAANRLLQRISRRMPGWQRIHVIDGTGVIVAASKPEAVGIYVADRPHVREALATGDFVVGRYLERRSDNQPSLPLAMGFRDAAGEVRGVATVLLDLDWLTHFLAGKRLPYHGALLMADADGVVLARVPENGSWAGRRLPDRYLPLLHAAAGDVVDMPGVDDVDRLFAYSPVETGLHRVFLGVGLDRNVALRQVEEATMRGAELILLDLVAALAVTWAFSRRFLRRPIGELVATIGRWRSGDRSARAQAGGAAPELVEVMSAFNGLADELEETSRERDSADARHRAVIGTAMDAIVVIDDGGTILSFNPAAERIFGYGAEEAIGRDVSMLMPEAIRREHGSYIERYKRTGDRQIIGIGREVEGLRRDGTMVPLDLSIAEWTVDGRTYFTGIMRDVTRRREHERELLETTGDLQMALEGAQAGTWHWNIAENRLRWSKEVFRLLGMPDEERELTYAGWCAIVLPEDLPAAERDLHEVLACGALVYRSEYRVRHPLHGHRWLAGLGRVFYDEAGNPLRISGIIIDITERKRAEEQVMAAKLLAERADRAKSQFLAAASHDLRQPAQSLVLFVQTLQNRLRDHPARNIVDHMARAIDAMRGLLDALLDISRLDAGAVQPLPADVALQDLLHRLCLEYLNRAAELGLRFTVARTSATVHSDPALLERMLRNLIENALRYTPTGRILVGCRRRPGHVRIEIHDTGVGIPADQVEAVWQEFHQVGNPERDRERGLGLGLAIVRRTAALLGHHVALHSRPGRGSCFSIEVPLAGRTRRLSAEPEAVRLEPGRVVLVIDDEKSVRDSIGGLLETWGISVLAAASADEAMELLAPGGDSLDLVIADYRLRDGRNGVEAIERIHRTCGRPVPSLVLTGETAPERIAEVRRSGYAVLHKPVSPSVLQDAVGRALRAA